MEQLLDISTDTLLMPWLIMPSLVVISIISRVAECLTMVLCQLVYK